MGVGRTRLKAGQGWGCQWVTQARGHTIRHDPCRSVEVSGKQESNVSQQVDADC